MKPLQARTHIALGQSFLVVTVLLSALFVGLIPDRQAAVREGRAALAETIAVKSSTLMIDRELERLEATLRFVVERNDQLLSAAVRRGNGMAVVSIGDHDGHWRPQDEGVSTEEQVVVPIWSAEQLWGQVELRLTPLSPPGIAGWLSRPMVLLSAFMGLASFLVFYFYLGKVLKHLDPNRAVPAHVRSALDTLAEGLLVVDLKGNIVLANSAFGEVAGMEPTSLVGRKINDLKWTDAQGVASESSALPWMNALRVGIPQRNELLHYRDADDRLRSFQVNSSPILGGGDKHNGVLISFDDVTDLENHKVQLRASRDEAESANRAKSEFLASMSHEIRTPMNAILGFTDVLKRGYARSETEWRRYLDTIHASGTHLLQLINNVLDLSKVESGRLEVEQIPMSPYGVVTEAVNALSVKATEKELDLTVTCREPIPQTVVSDSTRVRQIVTNLLGNAIKFTTTGCVTVDLGVAKGPQEEDLFCIDVRDTGVGIPADRLDMIFDPFTQADSSVTRQFGGTGLGLSISRRFARALGGDIVVTSEPGAGSIFSVRLATGTLDGVPMLTQQQLDTRVAEAPAYPGRPEVKFAGSRVLVVDDGAENRELVRLLLEDAGLRIDEAEDGRGAVDKATGFAYDAILMDMQMPVMSGVEATRVLRQRGVTIPVIALTANAMAGSQEECIAAGYSGFLTKPVDADQLIGALAGFLPLAGSASAVESGKTDDGPPALSNDGMVRGTGPVFSRLARKSRRYDRIIGKFIDRLDSKLDEFETALSAAEFDRLEGLAQWLKGSAVTVGFDDFKQPSLAIETLCRRGDSAGVAVMLGELRALSARLSVGSHSGGDASADLRSGAVPPATTAAVTGARPADNRAGGKDEPAAPIGASVSSDPAGTAPPSLLTAAEARPLTADPRFRRIQERFVKRLADRFDKMERALRDRDFSDLAQHGHWLKGSGGTVGYDEFTLPAKELEESARARNHHKASVAMAQLRRLAAALTDAAAQPSVAEPADSADPLDVPRFKEAGGVPIP